MAAQSFADAFTRDAQPDLESPARGFMREIVGASRDRREGGLDLWDPGARPLPVADPADQACWRLHHSTDDGVLLPDPARHADRRDRDPAGSGPYYVYERIPNQRIVLRRNPFYREGARRTSTRSCGRSTARRLACLPSSRIGSTTASLSAASPTAYRGLAEKYGINRPDGQLFVRPGLSTWYYAFNHDRPAFDGPGQIPLKKAINFAIDRLALTRPAGYLAGKRTDQILPPALARSASIYPLGGLNLAAARRFYARARYQPTTLVLYTASAPSPSPRPSRSSSTSSWVSTST